MSAIFRSSLIIAVFCYVSAYFEDSKDVVTLTPANFDSVKEGKWYVEFYNPACAPCGHFCTDLKKLAAIWKSSKTENGFQIGAVNVRKHPKLVKEFGLDEFPSLMVFGMEEKPVKYEVARNRDALLDHFIDWIGKIIKNDLYERRDAVIAKMSA